MESLTRPSFHHRRKLSTASSSNGLTFSGKDEYDDLLSSNKKTKLRRGVVVHDYGEIFGAGAGFSGVRGSSIPVLDLSDLDRPNGSDELRSSDGQLDYSSIFGAAAGSVPPYEEVFGGGQNSKSSKVKPRATTDKGSKGSGNLKDSGYARGCLPDASNQVFESAKHMNVSYHKTSQQGKDGSKGTTHIAQLDAVPGFTCFVNGDTHLHKQDHDKAPSFKSETDGKRSTGDKLSDGKSDRHKTSQEGKDSSKGTTHIAQFNAVPGFTCFVNGDTLLQKQDHDKAPPMKRETNDKRNTSDELLDRISGRRAKWKLQNPPTSESINEKGDTGNPSGINRRLFHSGEIDVKSLKVPPPSTSMIDRSYPNGKLFYSGELDLKSRPSKVPPLSRSSSQLNDNKVHLNQSKSFAFGSKVESLEKDTNGYLSPSDEELDVESAAGVSAAALKKAIEQAQESIRLAKELMERKNDPMKTRSRSALKVKDVTETKHDQHFNRVRKNNMDSYEVVETEAPVSTEVDKNIQRANVEVNFAVKDREALQEDRTIEVPKQEESAEAVEGGMSSWFTQLLNNGKNKMAALASQLVDNKNNGILPQKNEQLQDTEIIRPTVETLEKVETVARIPDPVDAKGERDTLHRPKDLDKNVDVPDSDKFVEENDSSVELDEATKNLNIKFKEGEKSEKNLEDLLEMTDPKKIGSGKWEKDHPAKDFLNIVESKDEAEKFKLEKEETFIAGHGLEVNGSTVDAADAGTTMEKFSQEVEVEKLPKTASGNESNGEKLEDVAEIRLECNNQNETDKQMPLHSHDRAVNQMLSKEECLLEGLDATTTSNHEQVATNFGHGNAGEILEKQAIDVEEKLKGVDNAESEINQGIEISKTGEWPECANENPLKSSLDSCGSDNTHMPSETFEAIGLETNIFNKQLSQLETANILSGHEEGACQLQIGDSEGNDDIEYEEDGDEVEQEVEEAFRSKVSESYEKSYFNQGNEEGGLLETTGRKDEENDDLDSEEDENDLDSEEDEKQVEQAVQGAFRLKESELYETPCLDQNNEEEDLFWTGRKYEAIDDLESDEKEVAQAGEEAWRLDKNELLDQSNVQGDVSEAIVQGVSKAPASDEKTDNVGSATAVNEENTDERALSGDVDLLLKTTTFIHIGTEEHDTKKDRDNDESPHEECPPKFGFTDMDTRIQTEETGDDPNIFIGPEITAGLVHENEDICVENVTEDIMDAYPKEVEKGNNVEDHQEREGVEKHEEPSDSPVPINYEKCKEHLETDSVLEKGQRTEVSEENLTRTKRESTEIMEAGQKGSGRKDFFKKIEIIKRERERQKDRIAVERAIREARERAFAEARERAERAAVEKASAEVRQRVMAEAWEKLGKVASGKVSIERASTEAKLKSERAAVERATAEARERALEKAISQKTTEARSVAGKAGAGKLHSSTNTGLKHSFSSPDLEEFDDSNNESAQRRKARLERHQRIMERAAKALAEKNMRDILAQREQAERNRLAETLDAEIKRWASGKEGNLRALLSTLQYILGAHSGWQPITLTEIVTTAAVKKAYRKATLYVHPDKLQQRGASIQQKYICEKVFDLLKAAWNKFNSEER